jgi:TrmH family RNA methyltransferase
MGISSIILVNPGNFKTEEAYTLAYQAKDILESIVVVNTLDDLLPEFQILIGTTNRWRENMPPLFSAKEMAPEALKLASKNKVGILFGRETNGLSNEELKKCNFISTIPMCKNYPSVNLAQSVMIYVYELFQATAANPNPYNWKIAPKASEEKLYEKLTEVVSELPINTRKGPIAFVDLFKRVLGRTCLETRDIRLFFKFFDLILKK